MKTVPRSALKNPDLWLKSLVESQSTRSAADQLVNDTSQQLQLLSTELKALKLARGKISRKIGSAKTEGCDTGDLVQKTQNLSKKIKFSEQKLIEVLQTAVDRLSADDKAAASTCIVATDVKPAYFTTHYTHDSNSVVSCEFAKSVEDAAKYTNYVNNHPGKTAYHRHELGSLIESNTRQKCDFLLAKDEAENVCGVLPITTLSSAIFGTYMVSMPWFNYGGPLADSAEIGNQLLQAASQAAKQSNCSHAEFRETSPRANWLEQTHKVSMTLPLPKGKAEFEKSLKSSIRAQSNKATRAGCSVEFGHENLLNNFFSVFSNKMRSLGTPIHSKQFFLSLLKTLKNEASICVVKLNEKPVAVGFLIAHGTTQEIPWASSLSKFDSLGVNMLLYRSILGNAAESGFEFFDFGRSSIDGPTFRFKKQWGAQAQQLYWHSWTADGNTTALSPDSPKYKLAIAVWKQMPVWLANLLGPALIRGLP